MVHQWIPPLSLSNCPHHILAEMGKRRFCLSRRASLIVGFMFVGGLVLFFLVPLCMR